MTEAVTVDSQMPIAVSICLAVVCALGSAVFSGLTLGLLTLDLVQLKLVIDRPKETRADEINSRYAKRILPLRKDGNYLLVTLLTGNVAVNAGFSLLLGGLTDGLVGFLVSTVVITLFGEILPQAICARHGLRVGGNLAWFVWALEWILYPVVKPIAAALNCLLGEDLGTIYDRKQLRALVEYHDNVVHVLTSDEARILKGGLEFAFVRVDKVMTPIDRVYGLEIDTKLTFERISKILSCGFSRIPVLDFSSPQCIVGLLYMKDLALFDPYAEVEVRTLLHLFGRNVYAVDDDTALLDLLTAFKKGHTHLAVVRSVVSTEEGDPYYRHVGIITLEDIIEEILQDEIHDEFDHEKQQQQKEPTISPSSLQDGKKSSASENAPLLGVGKTQLQRAGQPAEEPSMPKGASGSIVIPMTGVIKPTAEGHAQQPAQQHQRRSNKKETHWGNSKDCNQPQFLGCSVSKALAADRRPLKMISHDVSSGKSINYPVDEHTILRGRMKLIDKGRACDCLSRSEALAVSTFLCCAERCFQPPNVSPLLLLVLLQHMRPIRVGSGVQIYTRGSRAYHAALVLQGRLKLEVGSERIACRVGPWTTLAMHCLNMKQVPKEFQAKRKRLQQAIGSEDLSSYGGLPTLYPASQADVPTGGSRECVCLTRASEGEAGGGAMHFRTAPLHGFSVQHPLAGSGSSSATGGFCVDARTSRDLNAQVDAASSLDIPLWHCGSNQGSQMLRSASPRCFSVLQAPPLQRPAKEYLLACECKNPECQDALPVDAGVGDSVSQATPSRETAWRKAGSAAFPSHSLVSHTRKTGCSPRGCEALVATSSCTNLSAVAAASRSSEKAGSYLRRPEGASVATAHVSAPATVPATASPRMHCYPPLSPPGDDEDAAAEGTHAASRTSPASFASSAGSRNGNLRIRGPSIVASPDSCSAAPRDSAAQRMEPQLPERKRDGRSASRALSPGFAGNGYDRRQAGGKGGARMLGGSSNSSGSESHKSTNKTHRLFFGLLHGRPHGYRELKKRSGNTPFLRDVSPTAKAAPTAGIEASWAPESNSGVTTAPDGTVRCSVSLRSSPGAMPVAVDGAEAAEEDGSRSCSFNSSYTDATNGDDTCSKQSILRGGPEGPDTAHPHSAPPRPLQSEAMHGVPLPSSISRSSLGEEKVPPQQTRLHQLRQRLVATHHPLQTNPPASVSTDKVQEGASGNNAVTAGIREGPNKPKNPVGDADGASAPEPILSFEQQLEAQDTQLRGIMQKLSKPIDNPALHQMLNDSGWTPEDFIGVDSFFDNVAELSAYYPDFSSRTDGDCQLLMIPQWLYFYAVKTSLIHPVFVASNQKQLCARRLEGRPCQC